MQQRKIPGYTIVRPILLGGMTDLYVAQSEQGERVVIRFLKETYARNRDTRKRFLQAAEIQQKLDHPAIVPVWSVGQTDPLTPYMILPYIQSRTLRELLVQRHEMIGNQRFTLLRQMAVALHAIHQGGFLHLDYKPENVLVTADGQLFVIDFDLSVPRDKYPVKISNPAGTPAYMAPELLLTRRADERADIFSFGVMAYECCTFHKPFERNTQDEERQAQTQPDVLPDPIQKYVTNVPPPLCALILKSLAKDVNTRYPSMSLIIKALDHLL